jgi:nitrite reductase/ring-hydroxylating ferredoxin subunit
MTGLREGQEDHVENRSSLIDLGAVDEVLRTNRAVVRVEPGGSEILLVRSGHRVFAVANRCPHMGFPLQDAKLRNDLLTCRHHGFKYDLRSGACRGPTAAARRSLSVYSASIEQGRVLLRVPVPAPV